jgi:hypothetical protein
VISNPPAPCADDDWCDDVPVERMRWFTGRFMTARDLTDEQRYLVGRRWLLNRVLHGEGVVCGLRCGQTNDQNAPRQPSGSSRASRLTAGAGS